MLKSLHLLVKHYPEIRNKIVATERYILLDRNNYYTIVKHYSDYLLNDVMSVQC
jgi:hypothetical protein